MPIIRNAGFPGKVPLIVPEARSRVKQTPASTEPQETVFAEFADEIEQACRERGVSRADFEESVRYVSLCRHLREGIKLRPETEQRVRFALYNLKWKGRL